MLQAVNLHLILSPKQIDVLYNFHLILGQKQPQQAPLQIAAGCQSSSHFVPQTNRCTIQLLIILGTKAAAAGPFTDCYRLSICPRTNGCTTQLPFNPGTKAAAAGPFTDCYRLSICPQTNRCAIQLLIIPGTKAPAAGPFTDCYRLSICPQTNRCTIQLLIILGTKAAAAGPFTDCCRLSIFISFCPSNKQMCYTTPHYTWDKSSRSRPLYRLLQAVNLSPKQMDVLYNS